MTDNTLFVFLTLNRTTTTMTSSTVVAPHCLLWILGMLHSKTSCWARGFSLIPPLWSAFIVSWNLRAVSGYLSSRGMTLRRPAAHLRRAPGWRRSGDESYWGSLVAEGEDFPNVPRPTRTPRPQSAIEGGQLDHWLEQLQRMQRDFFRSSVQEQDPAINDWTTSMVALPKDPTSHAGRQPGIPSFSRGSSSCGSPRLCDSSLGSQESLQTVFSSPVVRRGSWERAHIMQAPGKEQTHLSYLAPVRIGWLPIQRRVTVVGASKQSQGLDQSAGQVNINSQQALSISSLTSSFIQVMELLNCAF